MTFQEKIAKRRGNTQEAKEQAAQEPPAQAEDNILKRLAELETAVYNLKKEIINSKKVN